MSKDSLKNHLKSIIEYCDSLDLHNPQTAQEQMNKEFPLDHDQIQEIFQLCQQGIEEKWICHRSNGPIQFSRVLKPDENELQYAVDAVLMEGAGPKHKHPQGEINLCFALEGEAKFEGNPQGWTVLPPESTHIPTVTDGKMFILYFLPQGQIEFV